jgi:hypothetical protein
MRKIYLLLFFATLNMFLFAENNGSKTKSSVESNAISTSSLGKHGLPAKLNLPVQQVRTNNPQAPTTSAIYIDDMDGANDTTALQARGYKTYFRGGGAQAGPTWFQGNPSVFPSNDGPTNGYVASNYQCVSNTNDIDNWLVLPALNITAGDSLSFYSRSPLGSTYPDSIKIMYSAVGDSVPEAASWVELDNFVVNTGGIWERKFWAAPASGATARFAIRHSVVDGGPTGNNSDYVGIDYIVVGPVPAPLAHDIAIVPDFPSRYTMIPKSQIQPIPVTAKIANFGANTETNVGFTAYLFEIHGGVPTAIIGFDPATSNNQASLLSTDTTTTILSAGTFTPTDTGVYAFMYIATMDNPDDNGLNDTTLNFIIVTDSVYARDYANIDGMLAGALGSATNTIDMGQTFEVFQSTQVKSATFFLGYTQPGDQLKVAIYSTNASGVPLTLLGQTPNYTVTTNDTANWVTLNFPAPIAVGVGKFAIVLTQLSTTSNIALAYTNNVYTPGVGFFRSPAGSGAWVSIDGTTFHIAFVLRPNLAMPVGLNESSFSSNISIYPNPSNGKVYIHSGSENLSNATVSVLNSIGQAVYTKSYDNLINTQIDLSSQANGVYSIQIKSAEKVITKSFVISNN